jgi:tRNA(fMet)-specific endonuclease VapC
LAQCTLRRLCITLGELHYGAEKSAKATRESASAHFSARLEVLSFSQKAAAHYGQIRTDLERKGRPVGACDMLTAADARSEGLIVVTNNTREFERMPGVRVENWI